MTLPLEGIMVVDFTRGFPGHLASMVLSDNGADVIRVEPPGGDADRRLPAFRMWRRGQKSVTLDLHDADGRRQAAELACQADVVIQNWRPGVAESLGLDYETLAKENAALVLCEITGFGKAGRWARLKGYEGIVGALSGRFALREPRFGLSGRTGPLFQASPHASYGAAQLALQGIFAALFVRERCGQGQKVETSLIQGMTPFDTHDFVVLHFADQAGSKVAPSVLVSANGLPASPYFYWLLVARTKDGKWLQFANVMPHLWRAFLQAADLLWTLDDAELSTAPRFESDPPALRFWNILLERIAEKTCDEWMAIFLQDDDIAVDVIRSTQDSRHHPQMAINGYVVDVADPDIGATQQIGPQFTLWETPAHIQGGAPAPGAHNALLGATRAAPPPRGRAPLPASPLAGVTVIELGTWFAAPFGVTLLAELGARVIKVEQLDGDPYRYGMPTVDLMCVKTLQGKESVAVDFRKPEGRAIVHELVRSADMVMCSFRQGVAQRFGVDYEALKAVNPRILFHCGVSYGVDGAFPRRPVFGPTPPAIVGEAHFQAGEGNVPLEAAVLTNEELRDAALKIRMSNPGMGDPMGALGVATGMLLSLLTRERTGIGQQSMTSMLGSCAYALSDDFIWYDGKPERRLPDPELYGMGPLYRLYRCRSGWVFLAAPQEREWPLLCGALAATAGGADLAGDRRFATAAAREANGEALAEVLAAAFSGQAAAFWEDRMLDADVACAQVYEDGIGRFMVRHPLMHENDFVAQAHHFSLGSHPRHGLTLNFSRTPGVIKPAPAIGMHTAAALGELGYSSEQIAALEAAGVVRLWRGSDRRD